MKPKIDFSPGMWYTFPGDFMYNEAVKERFLETYGSEKFPRFILSAFEPFEVSAGKDIAQANHEEAKQAIESLDLKEVSTLRSAINVTSQYVTWCRENQSLPNISDGILKLKAGEVDLSAGLASTLFRDETDLLHTIRLVRTIDEGFPEPPFLCLCWLGLKGKEAIAVRDEDIDLEARTVLVNGETVVSGYSDAIADIFEEYVACKSAERDHKNGPRLVLKDYSTGMFLKKMLPRGHKDFGKPIGYSQITSLVNQLNARLEEDGKPPRLKPDAIWNSGCYRRLWELESAGINVKGNHALVEQVFRHQKNYYNALRMYEAYKKAFGLGQTPT